MKRWKVKSGGETRWAVETEDNGEHIYIWPINDVIDHEAMSDECFCRPELEIVETNEGDSYLYTHSSVDGRELRNKDVPEIDGKKVVAALDGNELVALVTGAAMLLLSLGYMFGRWHMRRYL